MPPSEDRAHSLKRIVLPSGKTIEVVHFADGSTAAHPDQVTPEVAPAERELHVCPCCESELVYPVSWHEAGTSHWNVTLRCPACEHVEQGTFHQEAADRFDEELERGTDALVRDLKRLTRANMAEELELLVTALEADALQPMDFGQPAA